MRSRFRPAGQEKPIAIRCVYAFDATDPGGRGYRLHLWQHYSVSRDPDTGAELETISHLCLTEHDGLHVNRVRRGEYRTLGGLTLSSADPLAP